MTKRLLFVAAGQSQVSVIREARTAGHYVIAMDGSPNAEGIIEADNSYIADIRDPEEIIRIFHESQADGIASVCCDVALEAVARACSVLRLPGLTPEVARVSRSKLLQREAFRSSGLLTPDFCAVLDVVAALNAWDEFQADACVVKPVDASGSRGVSFVGARENVAGAFELAQENSNSGYVIVESFMSGIEYSVEAWVVGTEVHVLAMSEKVRTEPPGLLDRQVHFPDSLPPERRSKMIESATRAIQACGLRDCPVHLECIDNVRGPVVVELAARGAGFKVFTEILPRITGISTARASMDTALGIEPNFVSKSDQIAASLVFIDPLPGILKAVHGVDEARKLLGVEEVVIYLQPGERMKPLRSGSDRVGHILVYNQSANACRATAKKALDLIQLEVEH